MDGGRELTDGHGVPKKDPSIILDENGPNIGGTKDDRACSWEELHSKLGPVMTIGK